MASDNANDKIYCMYRVVIYFGFRSSVDDVCGFVPTSSTQKKKWFSVTSWKI